MVVVSTHCKHHINVNFASDDPFKGSLDFITHFNHERFTLSCMSEFNLLKAENCFRTEE